MSVVRNNTIFALVLYQELNSHQDNILLSPYSISTALAMTYAGAKGETEKQMSKTLNFNLYNDINETTRVSLIPIFHKTFGGLIRQLNESGKNDSYDLVVANALWGQKDYEILPEFLNLVKTNYDGDLQQVDFATQADAARKTINNWIENKTRDKIKELIKPAMLNSMTRLVLTNAVYFKGKWASPFKLELTEDAPFTLLGGDKVTVPMMNQIAEFGYTQTRTIQVLELPYANNDLSMVILLPKRFDGINKLEEELFSDNLDDLLGKLKKNRIQVCMPKFKITKEFVLARVLSSMGMPDAFSGKADFSGMTDSERIFISEVIHKTYIEVNEEGTEAAAATGEMILGSANIEPPIFRADHPFIFLIRDNHTGSILFLGRIANPASQDN